jgi:hypothetical protein
VSEDVLESPADVYLFATNRLLLRNIATKRTFTSTADKIYFLCELAWEMIHTGELRIHYRAIPDRIATFFKEKITDQHELDSWDYDLRSQTLLHRDSAGYFTFAHKSLAEYFVAFKFAAELGCLRKTFAETYREEDGHLCQIPYHPFNDPEELVFSFGTRPISSNALGAVRTLLVEMLDDGASERLWKLISSCRGQNFEAIRYVAGNAASLVKWLGSPFQGADLSELCLAGCDLSRVDLRETRLKSCDLHGGSLVDSLFSVGQLKSANLQGVTFSLVVVGEAGATRRVTDEIARRSGMTRIYSLETKNGGCFGLLEVTGLSYGTLVDLIKGARRPGTRVRIGVPAKSFMGSDFGLTDDDEAILRRHLDEMLNLTRCEVRGLWGMGSGFDL